LKIAITGGRGFVGKYLLDLLGEYHDCIVLGRDEQEDFEINGRKIPYIQTNYEKEQLIQQLEGVQAVVHMAAKRYEQDEQISDYFTSINLSDNLFSACFVLKITNIVFLSSIAVYGANPKNPWAEETEISPGTFYGISKVTIEKLAEYYSNKYDLKIKTLRLAQIIGLGEREGYMITTFLNQAIHKKRLQVFGKGKGAREYIYVKDVARAIEKSLEKDEIKGIFNIGNNKSTSHRELAETINSVFNNVGNLDFLQNLKEDKSISLMNSTKADSILNWKTQWNMRDALIDMRNNFVHID